MQNLRTHLPGDSFGLRNSARTLLAKNNSGSARNHLDSKVVPDNDDDDDDAAAIADNATVQRDLATFDPTVG
jgi:hypothetical protein